MSKQVTLTLSNELCKRAERWASINEQDLQDALIDALCMALTPASDAPRSNNPIASLSDEEVLARCQIEMDPVQAQRLSRLLRKQREGTLSVQERRDVDTLIHVKNRLWIRQSEAMKEAKRRGLREPSLA
ncbi:MAG: hypothetical protein PVG71_14575 [Anaerolineae bacterium]|jgi:hypothetical protein